MSESFTTNEKVAIFDRLYSYFTDPMGHDNQLVERELEKTKAENAKLRGLVKSMYHDLTNMTFPPDWVTDYEADMRELGIEVNG